MNTTPTIQVKPDPTWVGRSGHDFNSPSKLDLNALCPGRCNLERLMQYSPLYQKSSPAAERGKKLWGDLVDVLEGKREIEAFLRELEPEDKVPCRWVYDRILEIIDRAKEINPESIVTYELQVDISYLGISGGKHGSRIDVHILIPGYGSIVIDVKLGIRWESRPQYNRQFKAYSSAVHRKFGGPVEAIKLQPALSEEYQYMSHKFEDCNFEAIDNDIVMVVWKTRQDNAPLVRGEHCKGKFCWMVNGVCPLYKQTLMEIPEGVDIANYFLTLNPVERKEFYEKCIIGKSLFTKAEETIKEIAIQNNLSIKGWEIGEGRKSYAFINEQTACTELKGLLVYLHGLNKCTDVSFEDFFTTRQLKSLSNIKKLIGSSKVVRETLKYLIVESPEKPTLKKSKD